MHMSVAGQPHPSALSAGTVSAPVRSGAGQTRVRLRDAYLRPLAMWRGLELDHVLASGAAPHSSPLLSVRAQMITGLRSRRRVADGLIRAHDSALQTRPVFTAAVRARASELTAARAVLAALDRRLRSSEAVSPQGVALLRTLLTDGSSPLYRNTEPGTLASELRAAAVAMAASCSPSGAGSSGRWTSGS
jgi:hypothetical protein